MLKRLLNRDASAKEAPSELSADPVGQPQPAAPQTLQTRKAKSMRDSDIKDEHGRSAEEIAAEAAREFDIDAVVRKAALPAGEAAKPHATAPQAAPARPAAPQQPAVQSMQQAPATAPLAAPKRAGVSLENGHIFLPGPSADDIARTRAARDAYWDGIGTSETELLGYPVSPQVLGQPAWPTQHQNFRIVRTAGSLIIASEGLSDPFGQFDGRVGMNGFGLEVFLELVGWQDLPAIEIRKSWAFRAVEYVARVAAHAQTLHAVVSGHEVISVDIPMACAPGGWVVPGVADPAGALLNVAQPPGRSTMAGMPLSPVSVVPVTPIFPEELESCILEGPLERRALANDLLTSGAGHRMNEARRSLR